MNAKAATASLAGGLGLLIVVAIPVSAAPRCGHLMELTVRMQRHESGMPAVPPYVRHTKLCTGQAEFDVRRLAENTSYGGCTVRHYAKHGSLVTFDAVCGDLEHTASHGVFHLGPGPDFTGTINATGRLMGHVITDSTSFAGRQRGPCACPKPGATG